MTSSEVQLKLKRLNQKICCVSKDVNNLLSEDIVDALENATNPSLTNVFITEEDLDLYLPQDVIDALTGANIPSSTNVYATIDDLSSITFPDPITVVANYAALPAANTVPNQFYWAEAAQGTSWLPGNLGGTYYPLGIYYSNGVSWTHIQTPYQATQAEVNTGTNNDKFVTPETLKMSTQWDGVVLLAGRSGGQTINGGTGVGESLTLMSTSNGTKGKILFGNSAYDEVNNRLGIGTQTPLYPIHVVNPLTGLDNLSLTTSSGRLRLTNYIGGGTTFFDFDSGAGSSQIKVGNNTLIVTSPQLSLTANTLTGSSSTSALSISQTWNTTGNPTAILLNVTNTASGSSSNLMDLQVGGVSQFKVSKAGVTTANGFQSIAYNESFQRVGFNNGVNFIARTYITAPATGILRIVDNTEADFNRIQFGGGTSSFPSFKRNAATIETRLADDSNFAAEQSLYQRFGSGSPEGVVTAPIGAYYSRTDGGAGTSLYIKESGTGNTGWIPK